MKVINTKLVRKIIKLNLNGHCGIRQEWSLLLITNKK